MTKEICMLLPTVAVEVVLSSEGNSHSFEGDKCRLRKHLGMIL